MSENLVDPDSFVLAKIKLTIVMATLLQIKAMGGEQAAKATEAFSDLVEAMKILDMDISDQTIM